jgi:glucosyl-3-phosphoglycerate phosphatase
VTRLLVWRHGRTEWNSDARVQGQTDTSLDDVGRAEAAAVAPVLAAQRPEAIVSSDLRRCTETAAALSALTGLAVIPDARLRERHHGLWQGLHVDEIAERWPEDFRRWRAGEPVHIPSHETNEELAKRVSAALRDAAELAPDGTVVVVTHGAAARFGIGALLGWPEAAVRTLGVLGNCGWGELRFEAVRGWQLRAYNVDGTPPVTVASH